LRMVIPVTRIAGYRRYARGDAPLHAAALREGTMIVLPEARGRLVGYGGDPLAHQT